MSETQKVWKNKINDTPAALNADFYMIIVHTFLNSLFYKYGTVFSSNLGMF